ncbi:MAG: hypothetical protein WC455_28515 [Dehalococcoidia bacterium]|jgi:hypothetical protein
MPEQQSKSKKSGGSKKIGRNKNKCGLYRSRGRRETNKAKNIARHFRFVLKKHLRHGTNLTADGFNAMRRDAKDNEKLMKIIYPIYTREVESA